MMESWGFNRILILMSKYNTLSIVCKTDVIIVGPPGLPRIINLIIFFNNRWSH